jgi:hypothetical protein
VHSSYQLPINRRQPKVIPMSSNLAQYSKARADYSSTEETTAKMNPRKSLKRQKSVHADPSNSKRLKEAEPSTKTLKLNVDSLELSVQNTSSQSKTKTNNLDITDSDSDCLAILDKENVLSEPVSRPEVDQLKFNQFDSDETKRYTFKSAEKDRNKSNHESNNDIFKIKNDEKFIMQKKNTFPNRNQISAQQTNEDYFSKR